MSFIERWIEIVAPHDCLLCGAEGSLLCSVCLLTIPRSPERCYRCKQASTHSATCHTCRDQSQLQNVFVAKAYIGAAKELVWRLKYSGAQAAAKIMAREMAAALPPNRDKGTIIVPVPTASSRVRQRGYDQASLLARELSKITGVPVKKLLTRLGASQQVGADRDVRRSQLQDAFIARKPRKLVDQTIVLVDDVLTTGATFESAARCLANAGATRIVGVAFASGQIDL